MKIKNFTIYFFAVIGFVAILSSFNNQSEETHSTPESHIWESSDVTPNGAVYMYNKVTGEVYYLKIDSKKYPK